jgi:tetratricopeptide (TPR) repeat protein
MKRTGFIMILMFLPFLLISVADAGDLLTSYNQGVKDFEERNLAGAESNFLTVMKIDPKNANACHNLIAIYIEQNKFLDALDWLTRITNMQVSGKLKKAGYFYLIGDITERMKNPAAAERFYLRSLSINSNGTDALTALGKLMLETGDTRKSIFYYEKAAAGAPGNSEAHFGLGNAYRKLGDNTRAIDEYNLAVRADPGSWRAWMNLGLAYSFTDQYDEAIQAYTRTLGIRTDYADVYYDLGNAYRYKGNYEEMIKTYLKALELKPDFVEASYNLACYYAIQKNKESALLWLKKSLAAGGPDLKKKAAADNDFQFYREDKDFKKLIK